MILKAMFRLIPPNSTSLRSAKSTDHTIDVYRGMIVKNVRNHRMMSQTHNWKLWIPLHLNQYNIVSQLVEKETRRGLVVEGAKNRLRLRVTNIGGIGSTLKALANGPMKDRWIRSGEMLISETTRSCNSESQLSLGSALPRRN